MSQLSILIADPELIGQDLDYSFINSLGKLCFNSDTSIQVEDLIKVHRPNIIIANRPQFSASTLQIAKKSGLQLLCLVATGTNTVDIKAAKSAGIAVCNILNYSTVAVAQHALAMVLHFLNKCPQFNQHVRTYSQNTSNQHYTKLQISTQELDGKTWGLVGLGAIGRQIAQHALHFGCKVIYSSLSGIERIEPYPLVSLDELLSTSDIISLHSPYSADLVDIINYQRLSNCKPNCIMVNVGRGGIISEVDLARALHENRLAAAGLDVLWPEPPLANNPLLSPELADRVLITPHVAWAARESRQRAISEVGLNIQAYLQGENRNRLC